MSQTGGAVPALQGGTPPLVGSPNDALAQLMKILQATKGQNMPKPGAPTPGTVPPPTTAASVGQAGPPPPVPNAAGASSMPMPQGARPAGPAPQPPVGQTMGLEFGNPNASRAATIQGTVSGIANAIHQFNEKKKAEQAKKAEGYVTQLGEALKDPDWQKDPNSMANIMLTDPKIVKTIEKGLDYEFVKKPAEQDVKKEPEPPEATGLKAGLQRLVHGKPKQPQPSTLPMPNTPGGIMTPKPSADAQSAAMISNARRDTLQSDPQALKTAAMGTGLSGDEQKHAEMIAKGLEVSPAEIKKLDVQSQISLAKSFATMLTEKMKADSAMARTKVTAQSRESSAKIVADARKYAADTIKSSVDLKKGKLDQQLPLAYMKHYDNMQKTYAQLAAKSTNNDEKAMYQKKADDAEANYNKIQDGIEDQKLMNQFNNVLDGMPAEEPSEEDDENPDD